MANEVKELVFSLNKQFFFSAFISFPAGEEFLSSLIGKNLTTCIREIVTVGSFFCHGGILLPGLQEQESRLLNDSGVVVDVGRRPCGDFFRREAGAGAEDILGASFPEVVGGVDRLRQHGERLDGFFCGCRALRAVAVFDVFSDEGSPVYFIPVVDPLEKELVVEGICFYPFGEHAQSYGVSGVPREVFQKGESPVEPLFSAEVGEFAPYMGELTVLAFLLASGIHVFLEGENNGLRGVATFQ